MLWGTMKQQNNICLNLKERSQINNSIFHLQELEKQKAKTKSRAGYRNT